MYSRHGEIEYNCSAIWCLRLNTRRSRNTEKKTLTDRDACLGGTRQEMGRCLHVSTVQYVKYRRVGATQGRLQLGRPTAFYLRILIDCHDEARQENASPGLRTWLRSVIDCIPSIPDLDRKPQYTTNYKLAIQEGWIYPRKTTDMSNFFDLKARKAAAANGTTASKPEESKQSTRRQPWVEK